MVARGKNNPETIMFFFLASLFACNTSPSSLPVEELQMELVPVENPDVHGGFSFGAPPAAHLKFWYLDLDQDGFGDGGQAVVAQLGPAGYVMEAGDCNDEDPMVRPGEIDDCDGVDSNCDGVVDESGTRWLDQDGDGFGGMPVAGCMLTPGLTEWPGDCDDSDPDMSPAELETCNGIDENCNRQIDDQVDCGCDARSLADGGSLLVCDAPTPWEEAANFCAERGYRLATIFNAPDNMLFRSIAATHDRGDWWVGLYEAEGSWRWVDQSAVVYTDWMSGQPADGGACATLSADPRAVGSWRVTGCEEARSFLCVAD
jgi:Lectin C-type domain/Putative metal-binding motif